MTRSELMERMPASEFFEWMILEQVEPFGDKRGDIQAGMISQILLNIHRDPKRRPTPYELEECLPRFVDDKPRVNKRQQSPEEQLAIWTAIMAAQNAKFKND